MLPLGERFIIFTLWLPFDIQIVEYMSGPPIEVRWVLQHTLEARIVVKCNSDGFHE